MNEKLLKYKWPIIFTFIIILGFISIMYNYNKKEVSTSIPKSEVDDRITVGQPALVKFEDIKTSDSFVKENDSYIYSQIRVENISDETVYGIIIYLKEYSKDVYNDFFVPSYSLDRLEPGEVAILSAKHENKKDDKLKIESYHYEDSENNQFSVNNPSIKKINRKAILTPGTESLAQKNIIKEVKRVKIMDIRTIKNEYEENLEIDIKNVSNDVIKNIVLTFDEIYIDNVIGNSVSNLIDELKPKEEYTIRKDFSQGVELDLIKYSYSMHYSDDKNKLTSAFDVYLKEHKYTLLEFEDSEIINKRYRFMQTTNFVAVLSICTLSSISRSFKKKGKIKKAKYIDIFKWILFIFCIIWILYINIFNS